MYRNLSMPGALLLFLLVLIMPGIVGAELRYQYDDAASETDHRVPSVTNLAALAETAAENNSLILIEYSTPGCDFCEVLEEEVIAPLLLSPGVGERLLVRRVSIDSYSGITGFDGRRYSAAEFSNRHGVDLYPSLLFFNARGEEVAERIVGVTTLDYVQQRLDSVLVEFLETGE